MSDNQIPEGMLINSIIGEGTRFNGDFDLNGLLRIDGDFLGTIRTGGKILIGRNGRAECNIHAGTVVIGGIVRGNVNAAEKVIILSTGMMLGNIITPRLIAEEGVIFNGDCKIKRIADRLLISPEANQERQELDEEEFKPNESYVTSLFPEKKEKRPVESIGRGNHAGRQKKSAQSSPVKKTGLKKSSDQTVQVEHKTK